MGRFHKTYTVNGNINESREYIERYLRSRGYEETEAYYGRRMFAAYDSALPTIFGADNNMRFIDVFLQDELIVIEAWILNAYAVANDRSWANPAFITKLDKNEIDPSEERSRLKAGKKDLLILLEDIVFITEEYNRRQTVDTALKLPSGCCYAAQCDSLDSFIKAVAPPSIADSILKQSLFVYLMAFFAIVAAVTTSAWADIVQLGLIVLLTLTVHIKKSAMYSYALLFLCIGEVLLPFFFTSSSNWVAWLLLIDAYFMTYTFKTAKRMFLNSSNG